MYENSSFKLNETVTKISVKLSFTYLFKRTCGIFTVLRNLGNKCNAALYLLQLISNFPPVGFIYVGLCWPN